MLKGKYTVLGTEVNDPPQDGKNVAERQPLLQSTTQPLTTQPVFDAAGLHFDSEQPQTYYNDMLNYVTNSRFWYDADNGGWRAEGAVSVTFKIQVGADVSGVTLKMRYMEWNSGTEEGTAVGVAVSCGSGADQKNSGTAWKVNTYQPDWVWTTSQPFDLFEGINTVTLTVYVADDNDFFLLDLELDPPPFTAQPLTVNFFWKCIEDVSVTPGGSHEMSKSYTVGLSHSSSSTSDVTSTMGMSVGASFKGISFGLNKSIQSKFTNVEQVSINKTDTTEDKNIYPNVYKDKMMQLQLWQPCVEYIIGTAPGTLTIVDERQGDVFASMQYSPVGSNAESDFADAGKEKD